MSQTEFLFCPLCATRLEVRETFNQRRPVCPACGFVHFRDPKVAVIALVTSADRVLLIRRGIDPGRGKWALPGGYMDAGEMPEGALQRELQEEVALAISVEKLLAIFPMAGPGVTNSGIVLAYQASPAAGGLPPLECRDDVVEAVWFTEESIPENLAFDSTHVLLRAWRATQAHQPNREHLGDSDR